MYRCRFYFYQILKNRQTLNIFLATSWLDKISFEYLHRYTEKICKLKVGSFSAKFKHTVFGTVLYCVIPAKTESDLSLTVSAFWDLMSPNNCARYPKGNNDGFIKTIRTKITIILRDCCVDNQIWTNRNKNYYKSLNCAFIFIIVVGFKPRH